MGFVLGDGEGGREGAGGGLGDSSDEMEHLGCSPGYEHMQEGAGLSSDCPSVHTVGFELGGCEGG